MKNKNTNGINPGGLLSKIYEKSTLKELTSGLMDFDLVNRLKAIFKKLEPSQTITEGVVDRSPSEDAIRTFILNNSGESSGGGTVTKTKSEIDALISANGLVKGQLYEITGVDENWCDVFLIATSTNSLAQSGNGRFFNPNYKVYDIWTKYMSGTFSAISGTFVTDETVTANNGATAKYLAGGFIEFISGNWSGATSISGATATATVSGFTSPSYAVNAIVTWGGTHWKNLTGVIGSSVNMFNLDATNWQKVTTDLVVEYDAIEYDYSNDLIIARKDKKGNEISAGQNVKDIFGNSGVKSFQWGGGGSNNICNQGYLQNLNSLGIINSNVLEVESSFYGDKMSFRKNFENNKINSGCVLNFGSSITGNITNTTVEGFNTTTDISTATIIYQPYSKRITAREDGAGIITHWNNSNVQIINNITD